MISSPTRQDDAEMLTVRPNMEHISDHDRQPHCLDIVSDGELTQLEDHLYCCPPFVQCGEETQDYADAMSVAGTPIDEGVGVMAEPINSESRLFEMNKSVKYGGCFEESQELPQDEHEVTEDSTS